MVYCFLMVDCKVKPRLMVVFEVPKTQIAYLENLQPYLCNAVVLSGCSERIYSGILNGNKISCYTLYIY
jgi:hypothetical protein